MNYRIVIVITVIAGIVILDYFIPAAYASDSKLFNDDGSSTNAGSSTDDKIIMDYCLLHANKILLGGNPVNDLVATGIVSEVYYNSTCQQVKSNSEIRESFSNLMDELIVVPD